MYGGQRTRVSIQTELFTRKLRWSSTPLTINPFGIVFIGL
jgi:hypothetical protein